MNVSAAARSMGMRPRYAAVGVRSLRNRTGETPASRVTSAGMWAWSAQPHPDDSRARRERHEPCAGVRPGDRQPLARPDQVHARIRNDALLMCPRRDQLPRAGHERRADEALGVAHEAWDVTAVASGGRPGRPPTTTVVPQWVGTTPFVRSQN